MTKSIYYTDTLNALHEGTYISIFQMLCRFESYPMFDSQHARSEILRAVQYYNRLCPLCGDKTREYPNDGYAHYDCARDYEIATM